MSEFPEKAAPKEGHGDPAQDLPSTIRMQPPATWERRYDPATPRAVKADWPDSHARWVRLTGPGTSKVGPLLTDEDVKDWSVTSWLVVQVAMKKLLGPLKPGRATGRVEHERGDMDVDVFAGGDVG